MDPLPAGMGRDDSGGLLQVLAVEPATGSARKSPKSGVLQVKAPWCLCFSWGLGCNVGLRQAAPGL